MATLDKNVGAAEKNVDRLKYPIEQTVRDGSWPDATELSLDENRAVLVERTFAVQLSLERRAAWNGRAPLAEVKPVGAERLGHPAILLRKVLQLKGTPEARRALSKK